MTIETLLDNEFWNCCKYQAFFSKNSYLCEIIFMYLCEAYKSFVNFFLKDTYAPFSIRFLIFTKAFSNGQKISPLKKA